MSDIVERLLHRAKTMNGSRIVGCGDGGTFVSSPYRFADRDLDFDAINEITSLRAALVAERRRPQPIETVEVGQQMLAYEPMYGWLIVAKEANGSFVQKSSGNFWVKVPASVQFTHWLPYPEFLEVDKPE